MPNLAPLPALQKRPFLIQKGPSIRQSNSPLGLWHLLSLDAPTVAAVWTGFFAWATGTTISPIDIAAIFVAVWLLYAGDRLLDAAPLFTQAYAPELQERHRFHHRYRARFRAVMVGAALVLTVLLHRSADAVLHLYVLLSCLLGAWLLLVHGLQSGPGVAHRLPKEAVVGPFFAAAVCIPTLARAPHLLSSLAPTLLAFSLLCTLNCLYVYAWEHPLRQALAHRTTRWGIRHLRALTLSLALGTDVCFLLSRTNLRAGGLTPEQGLPHAGLSMLACSTGAALLLVLQACRHRLRPPTLRACADLVLLTPLPLLLAWHLLHD